MTDWLLGRLDSEATRLVEIAREAAGTPGGKVVTRLAMDQVAGINPQRKVIEIASKALHESGDPRFHQIVAWLAYAHFTTPGYLETWAPDEVDLIATLADHDLADEQDDD